MSEERPDYTVISPGEPYPEEVEDMRGWAVHDAAGAVKEQQEVDAKLHHGNQLAHEGIRLASRFINTRGDENVEAFRRLKEKVKEYEALDD